MTQENGFAKNLIAQRGRRASATLLTWLEDNVKDRLSDEEWEAMRSKVLSVVGEFQDLATDMVVSETGVINDYWAEAIADIKDTMRRIERSVDGHVAVSSDR